MRPIRLELKGFTSFRDEAAIDFTDLDLFAIVGPTGSGKSSLLDAITYALYGEVARIDGRRGSIKEMVSQGQPRMAATLEFSTGEDRLRITRTTSAAKSGQTKVLLERFDGEDWRQAGEGADRVREANAAVISAIGLDWEGFTRAVLLPQGRFAEFLVGDASKRRDLLTELLGLGLFERLRKRAGELKTQASYQADAKEDLLAGEYADVGEDAARIAADAARAAAAREAALSDALGRVRDLLAAGQRAAAELRELSAIADDLKARADVAASVVDGLASIAEDLAEADTVRDVAVADETRLGSATVAARDALEGAEAQWGSAPDLASLRTNAEQLRALRSQLADEAASLVALESSIPSLRDGASAAEKDAERARTQVDRAEGAAREARDALERTRHVNLVAAVSSQVEIGASCPVCGAEVHELAATQGSDDVDAAQRAVADADAVVRKAGEQLHEAERLRDASVDQVRRATEELASRTARSVEQQREANDAWATLVEGLGVDGDPIAELNRRLAELQRMATAARDADASARTAERARIDAEKAHAALTGRVTELRASLSGVPIAALVARAQALGAGDLDLAQIPESADLPEDSVELASSAVTLHDALGASATDVRTLVQRRSASEEELLSQARDALSGVALPGLDAAAERGLAALAEQVEGAAKAAVAEARSAADRAETIAQRLLASRAMREEVGVLRERAARFGALAQDLRADRIVEFLQAEALQMLASGASERLETLSDGRFRLAHDQDEFFVVDTWNGEEMRSARTLSGGETFLASLALALALSDQVRSLAVSDRAPLESLFLDEGFGTLDPDSLETVVGAIEQLGGDGRLVGVITHVQELAIRLPTRIEVQKSPRGSTVQVRT
ncbi:MAG: SMC family ATPase [Actinomycetota bacterium]